MNEFPIDVNVSELKRIIEILLTHLERRGISNVSLHHTYYWNITEGELYDPLVDPRRLNIGDLTDDWHFLKRILEDPEMAVPDAFVWLGSIMRAVGEATRY